MVYPVSGGVAQQIPAANTFQPGGTESAKRPEADDRLDSTKTTGSDTARSQSVDVRNYEKTTIQASAERAEDTGGINASTARGTSLDISV